MECDEASTIGKIIGTEKSETVSPSSMANRRQVKISVPQDRPSRVGVKLKSSRSNAERSKSHLAWYVAINSKPSAKKISQIPHIKWKCPPKFTLYTEWQVAAGEGSQEVEAQICRETKVPEIVYHCLSAIPPSPFSSPHAEGELCDNSRIPIVPTIPIEEMTSEDDKPVPDILGGLGSGVIKVVAAVKERKEEIDIQLLIKYLADPELIKKLIDKNGPTNEHSEPLAPTLLPTISMPSIPVSQLVTTSPRFHSRSDNSSRPDEETITRLVNKYRPPTTASSCLINPNMEVIKKMINQYGAPNPGPSSNIPPPVDLNYYKSIIKQHGQNHENKEVLNMKSGQGLRLRHNDMNQRYQKKPCVYFNSLKGCKNGHKCPYRHDGRVVEVPLPLAKRIKFG